MAMDMVMRPAGKSVHLSVEVRTTEYNSSPPLSGPLSPLFANYHYRIGHS